MEFLNIGPIEFLLVLVIMFVLLGPEEMKRTARRIAIAIRKFVRSPIWADITGMREEIRELPRRLIEETGVEDAVQDIKQTTTAAANEVNSAMKESMEAAKVRELDELRRETSKKLSPNAGRIMTPPKPSTQTEAEAAAEAAEEIEVVGADAAAAALASTLDVDIESSPREPAQDHPVAETANSILPPAEVVQKPRRKKAAVKAETDALASEEDAPAAKPRRAPRRKAEVEPPVTAPGKNGSAAEENPIAKDETNEPNAA